MRALRFRARAEGLQPSSRAAGAYIIVGDDPAEPVAVSPLANNTVAPVWQAPVLVDLSRIEGKMRVGIFEFRRDSDAVLLGQLDISVDDLVRGARERPPRSWPMRTENGASTGVFVVSAASLDGDDSLSSSSSSSLSLSAVPPDVAAVRDGDLGSSLRSDEPSPATIPRAGSLRTLHGEDTGRAIGGGSTSPGLGDTAEAVLLRSLRDEISAAETRGKGIRDANARADREMKLRQRLQEELEELKAELATYRRDLGQAQAAKKVAERKLAEVKKDSVGGGGASDAGKLEEENALLEERLREVKENVVRLERRDAEQSKRWEKERKELEIERMNLEEEWRKKVTRAEQRLRDMEQTLNKERQEWERREKEWMEERRKYEEAAERSRMEPKRVMAAALQAGKALADVKRICDETLSGSETRAVRVESIDDVEAVAEQVTSSSISRALDVVRAATSAAIESEQSGTVDAAKHAREMENKNRLLREWEDYANHWENRGREAERVNKQWEAVVSSAQKRAARAEAQRAALETEMEALRAERDALARHAISKRPPSPDIADLHRHASSPSSARPPSPRAQQWPEPPSPQHHRTSSPTRPNRRSYETNTDRPALATGGRSAPGLYSRFSS